MIQTRDMLELKSSIQVQCFVIEATLLAGFKTHYLLPILVHMNDSNGATADSLTKELFLSRAVGSLLLEKCAHRELSTENQNGKYHITDKGVESLNEKKIFDTRHGVWLIHYTDCPLIPKEYRMLHISNGDKVEGYINEQAKIPSKHDNMRHDKSDMWDFGGVQPEAELLPRHIQKLEDAHMITMMESDVCELVPKKIESYGKKFPSSISAILTWDVGIDKSSLSISMSGAIPESNRQQISGKQTFDGPKVSHSKIWEGLLRSLEMDSDDEYYM
ncbi:MAG: hypothetical protein OXC46_04945 [Thaumarchaeota archaeon]|nr:hypothetical protein [Nitrososphaerota archaeon]